MWVGFKYVKAQMKCTQELRWRFQQMWVKFRSNMGGV